MLEYRRMRMMRGLALLAISCAATAPLAAQSYPQGYRGPGYAYGQNRLLDQIVDRQIGRLYDDRQPIRQCVYEALNRAEDKYRGRLGPNPGRPDDGYNGFIRLKKITQIERRHSGTRVRGQLDAGFKRGYNDGDVQFLCDIDSSGIVGVVKIHRTKSYPEWFPNP